MEEPLVRIDHLTTRKGRDLLYGLTMNIMASDSLVLFGPESSGYRALMTIILGIDIDYDGDVYFLGRKIKDFDYIQLHNHKRDIGYLHGDYGLMSNMSVEQNISLPLDYHSELSKADIKLVVDDLVREFELEHCREVRPIGLTGAEILRTAYARAIVNDPHLLIVDQAMVDQSAINLRSVNDNLIRRMQDATKGTIFFTHRPEIFLDFANRFAMFYNGSVVFQGDRDQFKERSDPFLRQFMAASVEGPMTIR